MKRGLIFVPVFLIALLALAVLAFNFGLFHTQIERALAEKSGSKVQLGSTTLIPKWPLKIELGDTTLESELYSLKWKALAVELASFLPPYHLQLSVREPVFVWKDAATANSTQAAPNPSTGSRATGDLPAVALELALSDGDFSLPGVHLTHFNLNFSQHLLLKSVARLHLQTSVEARGLPLVLPLALDSDTLTLSRDEVKDTDLKLFFAGLTVTASGASLLTEGRHQWSANVSAPDLSKIPKPRMDIPLADWRGSVVAKAEVRKDGALKPWFVEGDVLAENVSATVKYHQGRVAVSGPFSLALATHVRSSDGVLEIPSLKGSVDFTSASVSVQDLLAKAPSVPLKASISAVGDSKGLKLETLTLEVWRAIARLSGQTALKAPYAGSFNFVVPSFSLDGADKVFLPLAKSPAAGDVAASGTWSGELLDASNGHFALQPLQVKDMTAEFEYDKPGVVKIKGPLKASLEGKLEASKKTLISANITGRLNASEAALVAGPLRKEAKKLLAADFIVKSAGNALDIRAFALDTFAGKMRVSGRVIEPFDPKLQLKVEVPALDLGELRVALPEYHDKIPKGSVSGQASVSGSYEKSKPWNAWPLAIEGAIKLTLPEYSVGTAPGETAAKTPVAKSASGKPAAANEAFLSPGYLIDHLKLKILTDIESLKTEKLTLKGAHVDGAVGSAHFKGQAGVREVFGGSVGLTGLDVPLTQPRPVISGTAKWRDLVIEDALGFVKPEYREFAKGRMAGQTEFQTYLPSDADFLAFLQAKGELTALPVTLNTVKVGEMINGLIRQAPGLKLQPVKVDPLHGQVNASYVLARQVVQVQSFVAKDVDNSELNIQGKVAIPAMQGDFAGTFYWAKPQVQGCLLEGNSDATGRMVIPVAIRGDLMHPGLDSLSDMINKLGKKALECEGKKLVDQMKKDGGKQLENEVKKQLQNLFGH